MNAPSIAHDIKVTDHMIGRKLESIRTSHENSNITRVQCRVISYIYDHPERVICQRDITNFLSVSSPTVAKMLRLMEDEGFIVRSSVKGDARLKRIELTDRSKAICPQVRDDFDTLEDEVRGCLDPEEVDTLLRLLDKLRTNLASESSDRTQYRKEAS